MDDADDIVQRITVLFILACLFGYTTNVEEAAHYTYQSMIAFFVRGPGPAPRLAFADELTFL